VNTIEKAKKLITSPHGFSVESSHDVANALIAANEVIAFYGGHANYEVIEHKAPEVLPDEGGKARNWLKTYSEE